MSTSDRSNRTAKKSALIYLGVTVFCIVFFLVYDRFSHGVHSPYMTYLFARPLVLGFFPSAFFWIFRRLRAPFGWALNFYHAGVAALTVSSMLRGIFEIAGNSSVYQTALTVIGAVLLAGGILVYFIQLLRPSGKKQTNEK